MNTTDFYETERALADYLLFHYGSAEQMLPWTFGPATALNYPARCVYECLETARLPASRARWIWAAPSREPRLRVLQTMPAIFFYLD
jgi:hypothetical protein